MNQALKSALIRFGRGVGSVAIAYGAQVGAEVVMGLKLPVAIAPFAPMVIGPAVQAAAKYARMVAGADSPSFCKLF